MSQHMDALAKANHIQRERSRIKKEVRDGSIDIKDLINDPPNEIKSMLLYDLLKAQHNWGRERTLRVFKKVGFSEFIKVGDLTERQQIETILIFL